MDTNQTNYGNEHHAYSSGATTYSTGRTAFYHRISWGAIIAGTLVALVTMLVLNLLGIGIGFGSINPVQEADPFSGLGTASIIWWVVSNLIAIFAGAYVAAKMAGVPSDSTSTMHGILSWCLYTLISFYILTTAVGSIISGVGSIVSSTLSAAGSGFEALASNNQQNQNQQNQSNLISFSDIQREASQILNSSQNATLVPDSIESVIGNVAQQVRSDVNISQQDIKNITQSVIFENGQLAENINRQDVINAVTNETNLGQQEANQVADILVREYNQAKQEVQQFAEKAKQQAEETGKKVAESASSAAIWAFVALLLGAIVAGTAGRMGKPTAVPVEHSRTAADVK